MRHTSFVEGEREIKIFVAVLVLGAPFWGSLTLAMLGFTQTPWPFFAIVFAFASAICGWSLTTSEAMKKLWFMMGLTGGVLLAVLAMVAASGDTASPPEPYFFLAAYLMAATSAFCLMLSLAFEPNEEVIVEFAEIPKEVEANEV